VAAIAKRDLKVGERIKKGIGSFDVRGIAIKIDDDREHIPIGLVADVTIKRDVPEGKRLTFDDVELPDTLAARIWKEMLSKRVSEEAS
jgi:predicted homoserine dehydrogenase-like protein